MALSGLSAVPYNRKRCDQMAFNGPLVLFLIVALVAFVATVTVKGWLPKLIFFIVTLGAASTAMATGGLSSGLILLVSSILFLVVGIPSVRIKTTGNRVLGIVFIILGLASLFPAINALGSETPGTVWDAIVRSFQVGWTTFWDVVSKAFGGT